MKKVFIASLILLSSYSLVPTIYMKAKGTKLSKENINEKICILTFDDGPSEVYTNKLLDLLKNYNIKATFFVVAKLAKDNPKLINRILSDGHNIGLHSLEHKNAIIQGYKYTRKDFKESLSTMKKLGVDIEYYRPPWGHFNIFTLWYVKKYNLKVVLWDVMAQDWKKNISSDEIRKRLIHRVAPFSIICLHDGRGKSDAPLRTIKALSNAIPTFVNNGYRFLKVDEVCKKNIRLKL